jgi:hypothetical protein
MPAHPPPSPSAGSVANISPPVAVAALAAILALLGCPGRGDRHPGGAPGASGGGGGRGSGAVEVAPGFLSATAVPPRTLRSAAAAPPAIETIDPALVASEQPENVVVTAPSVAPAVEPGVGQ